MAILFIDAVPLTHEAFAPYGDVIQGSSDPSTAPSHIKVNTVTANPITAYKYNRVSPIISTYPADSNAVTSVSVFRATPPAGLRHGGTFDVRMFERHACTTQAFIPMQRGEWLGEKELSYEAEMGKPGMVVLAALNGPDDKPDLTTLKVFLTSPAQGVCYRAGIWHHSMITMVPTDYACIDTQITTDSSLKIDCEILRRTPEEAPWAVISVP